MTIWIHTGGRPSNGAKALSAQPGFKRSITGKGVKKTDTIINWGSSKPFDAKGALALNHPTRVGWAANKLTTFSTMNGKVSTVEWTDDKEVAESWSKQGLTVVVRTKLTGHSGDGIIIVEDGGEVPDAPLYTRYVFKEKEFRVHVVCGKVIDTQRKIRDPDREPTTWKVRSHANGFIFARNDIDPDNIRDDLAISAIGALGLDFGAVDIIQDKKGKYYVLEVNTAPGLEGGSITNYAAAFQGAIGG